MILKILLNSFLERRFTNLAELRVTQWKYPFVCLDRLLVAPPAGREPNEGMDWWQAFAGLFQSIFTYSFDKTLSSTGKAINSNNSSLIAVAPVLALHLSLQELQLLHQLVIGVLQSFLLISWPYKATIPIHRAVPPRPRWDWNQPISLFDSWYCRNKKRFQLFNVFNHMMTSCVFKSCNVLCNCSCLGLVALEVLGEGHFLRKCSWWPCLG